MGAGAHDEHLAEVYRLCHMPRSMPHAHSATFSGLSTHPWQPHAYGIEHPTLMCVDKTLIMELICVPVLILFLFLPLLPTLSSH